MALWDVRRAVGYLNEHAREHSLGRCAEFVRKAIEAGGAHLVHHTSAKDYGGSLVKVSFAAQPPTLHSYLPGDVVVIQPIEGHPHGHMAMFNGTIWISDFKQRHGLYPGPSYRRLKPPFKTFRYLFLSATTRTHGPSHVRRRLV
jgi:hypothetical protein